MCFMNRGFSMGRFCDQGQIVLQASVVILIALFSTQAASEGGESSGVGNGGGPAEQAIVSAAIHSRSLYQACLLHPKCGANLELATGLKKLASCSLPTVDQLRFDLLDKPYVSRKDALVINRTLLYPGSRPASFSTTVGLLTRIYFELCGVAGFQESENLTGSLVELANIEGEQITVGKNDLSLPKQQLIRARTLYSDLLIETSNQMLRLHCNSDDLESCSVLEDAKTGTKSRFRNLSVASEAKDSAGRISFSIEGLFRNGSGSDEKFLLDAIVKGGLAVEVRVQGRTLELPKK